MSSNEQERVSIFRFLFTLISFRPWHFFWNVVGSIIFFMLPLVTAFAIREILNNLQGVSSLDIGLWMLVWIIPITYAIRMVVDIANVIVEFIFTMSLQVLLRSNLFDGIFKQPGADSLQGRTAGEAISRFRGDSREISWFVNFVPIIISFAIFFVFSFVVMFNINSTVTLIIFIPFILVVLLVNSAVNRLVEYRKETRKAAGAVTGAVGDIFSNIQAIKVNRGEIALQHHFDELSEKRRKAAVRDNTFASTIRSVGGFITSIGIGMVLLLIGREMQVGLFTVGDLSLFIFLLDWIAGFVRWLGEFISWQARAGVSYHRMYQLMKGVTDAEEGDLVRHHPIYLNSSYPEPDYLKKDPEDVLVKLEIRDMSHQYPHTTQGIENISFDINGGEFVVITGRVGSGKSTLLKALLGLIMFDHGTIRWNGHEVDNPADFLIPPRVVYTSQVPSLFSDTVRENLLLGLDNDPSRLSSSLQLGAVEEDLASFDKGLETQIGPRGIKLSGGQKYRIAAARMFMRESELIIVDDLSSALDVKTETLLWQRLFEHKHATFLLVSHRPFVLKRADKIILLKDGKVDGIGSLTQLLEVSNEMQQLWSEISLEKPAEAD